MAGGNSLDSLQMCMRSVLQEMATSLQYSPTWSTKPGDTWNSFSCHSPPCLNSHRPPIMVQGLRFYRCYSATKCRFLCLERGAQTGWMLCAPTQCDPAICLLEQRSLGKRQVARCTVGAAGQSVAPSSSIRFERKEKSDLLRGKTSHTNTSHQRWWLPLRMSAP